MESYQALHARSINDPDGFWREQARSWTGTRRSARCSTTRGRRSPGGSWAAGPTSATTPSTAISAELGDSPALIYVSTETGQEKTYTFRQLHREVNRMAGILKGLGVGKGDRVLIYMPMIAEATFAMLACARIGAIHSVVFGGFASVSLATRIDDAKPKLIVSADAGSRAGKPVPYKHLLDEAIRLSKFPPDKVLLVDRGLAEMSASRAATSITRNCAPST